MTTIMESAAAMTTTTMMEEDTAPTTTRIFLGGLGVNVTEDDLRSAFSSLGSINSVQIIRDKGRSIAYFDFLPSSEKSLSKLFSMYNGCIWKGGRLRIEKAKEHYTSRMEREWMEDAKPSITESVDVDDTTQYTDVPNKQKKLLKEDQPMLRIVFPCIRKVKLLPANGTGKHKYSFQRVVVPSLPVNFCDCEEHSGSSEVAKQEARALEVLAGGVDEQEFSMMYNVMDKLFAKQNNPSPITHGNKLVKGQHSTSLEDKLPVNNKIANETIDDGNNENVDDDVVDDDEDVDDDDEDADDDEDVDDDDEDADDDEDVDDDDDFVMNLTVGRKDQMANTRSTENRTIVQNKVCEDRHADNVAAKTNEISRKRKSYITEGVEKENKSSTTLADDLVSDDNLLVNVVTGGTTRSRIEEEAALLHQVSKQTRTGSVPEKNDGMPIKKKKSSTSEGNEAVVVVPKSKKARWNERMSFKSDQSSVTGMIDFINSSSSIPSVDSTNENLITPEGAALTLEVAKIDEMEVSADEKPEKNEHIVADGIATKGNMDEANQGMESNFSGEQTVKNESTIIKTANSGRGVSWLKKSSWNEMVGRENNSFSITHILPSATFANQEPEPLGITEFGNSANMGEHSQVKIVEEKIIHDKHPATFEENKEPEVARPVVSYTIGEKGSFVRSAASLKEWKNAKASLSGSFKKKGKEKKET